MSVPAGEWEFIYTCAYVRMEDGTVPDDLADFLTSHGRLALALSGGADSTYLLYAAKRSGADVKAFTVMSDFQPRSETENAVRMARQLGADVHIINVDVLFHPAISANRPDRCYHCKMLLFHSIMGCASNEEYDTVIDATNASDNPDGRPGMRALEELGILSPLRICGITKQQVRELSRKAGLPTWDMPSNSCLATRIPFGTEIDYRMLMRTESAERELHALGLSDIRVRTRDKGAVLETTEEQSQLLESNRRAVEDILLKYYPSVSYSTRKPGL